MPNSIAEPTPDDMTLALGVLTGIEFEFGWASERSQQEYRERFDAPEPPGVEHATWCTRRRPWANSSTWCSCGAAVADRPLGQHWFAGYDCEAEVRSIRPTPLRAQYAACREMFEELHGIGIRLHAEDEYDEEDYSFHVHINVNPDVGPAVDPYALTDAFMAMRDEMWGLCVDADRRECSSWCDRLPHGSTFDDVPVCSKEREITHQDGFGSMEIRIWDATTSMSLIRRRMDFLRRLIATALASERVNA